MDSDRNNKKIKMEADYDKFVSLAVFNVVYLSREKEARRHITKKIYLNGYPKGNGREEGLQ